MVALAKFGSIWEGQNRVIHFLIFRTFDLRLQIDRLRLIGFLPKKLVYSCNMDYSNLLNVINNDIELKGEVFKNLSKILFSIFSADKLEKQLHQYAKFLVLQTISSSEKGYIEMFS